MTLPANVRRDGGGVVALFFSPHAWPCSPLMPHSLLPPHILPVHTHPPPFPQFDALNEHACNAASKNYPIVVDLKLLKVALEDAIDTIGAYSHLNPAWVAEREKLATPDMAPPRWISNRAGAFKAADK